MHVIQGEKTLWNREFSVGTNALMKQYLVYGVVIEEAVEIQKTKEQEQKASRNRF